MDRHNPHLFDPLLDRVVPSAEVTTRGGELIHPTTGNRVTWEITGHRQARSRPPTHRRRLDIQRDRRIWRGASDHHRAAHPALVPAKRDAVPLRAGRHRGGCRLRRLQGRATRLRPRAGLGSGPREGLTLDNCARRGLYSRGYPFRPNGRRPVARSVRHPLPALSRSRSSAATRAAPATIAAYRSSVERRGSFAPASSRAM